MSDVSADTLDWKEQVARIDRAQEETRKFVREAHKLMAEEQKLYSEERKLLAEDRKLQRDRGLAPWQIVVTAMGAGAALFAAGAAFVKVFGH